MILKNKRTRETLNITLPEFKTRFAKELKRAFESYKQTKFAKPYFKIKMLINLIFILTYNGTLIIMPVLIGIFLDVKFSVDFCNIWVFMVLW